MEMQYQPKKHPVKVIIENNVPLPEEVIPKKRIIKYPFDKLEAGESFFVPDQTYKRLAPLARYWSRVLDRQFIVRRIGEGVRVWRRK